MDIGVSEPSFEPRRAVERVAAIHFLKEELQFDLRAKVEDAAIVVDVAVLDGRLSLVDRIHVAAFEGICDSGYTIGLLCLVALQVKIYLIHRGGNAGQPCRRVAQTEP